LTAVASRTYKTEAVVLRSMRFSEADRILHLYTLERGRIGAIAKGVRKTKSRFGARLEPLSHVELMLHEGSGELQTVTGADLIGSHHATREHTYRLEIGLTGAEAMLRLFVEPETNPRAFTALTRFLDALDDTPAIELGRPELDPLALSFQLKLLWVSGYLPHLPSCVECGATVLSGFSARAGGAVCRTHAQGSLALSSAGLAGIEQLLSTPLADARLADLTDRARREALTVVTSCYEEHGGFRLRTLSVRGAA
jgi:DNA repair protein RecO (recombination protein O)